METVTLEQNLALNVQGRHSELEYLKPFKATADTSNMAGGYAG